MHKQLINLIIIFVAISIQLTTVSADGVHHNYDFDITSQGVVTALNKFSRISDHQFMYIDPQVAKIHTQSLQSKLPVNKTLEQLLQGTRIKNEFITDNATRSYIPDQETSLRMADNMMAQVGEVPTDATRTNTQSESFKPATEEKVKRAQKVLVEITVTAQKREESLQDVPISILAFDGNEMRSNGISNLETLSMTVPNFFVAESFVGDAMFIRGVGSGQNNFGVEQAVGQVIDGVFYGRSRFSRLSFMDVERVEVLKGPQGALIGKNTTAGAVNITTRKPSGSFEAWLSPTYEVLADDGFSIEAGISGPLSRQLKGRLAVLYDNRDGYLDNTETGAEEVAREDIFARGTVIWEPLDNLDFTLAYQYGDIEHEGENNQYATCNFTAPQLPPLGLNLTTILTAGTSEDCRANFKRAGSAPIASRGPGDFSAKNTNFDTVSIVINWEVNEYIITSVTGFAQYEYQDVQDSDRSVQELLSVDFGEDYEQWSQELRIASPQGKKFDYIAGMYFQSKDQHSDFGVDISAFGARRNTKTDEDGNTAALFGQLTWHLAEQWDMTVGGRYTYEHKEARSQGFPSVIYTSTPTVVPPFAPAGLPGIHDVTDEISENNFSPTINLQWRPGEDSLFYASFRRGFKAGAFNHSLVATHAYALPFFTVDSEDVTAYEIGTKLTLLNGAAQVNAAYFHSKFQDLQQTVLRGADVINDVLNAGEATSQGVEIDLRWRSTQNLTLLASIAYLDSKFDEFPNATCHALQPATECVGGQQDLAGRPFQFAADWRGSFSAEYVYFLNNGFQLTGFLHTYFSTEHFLQQDLDPNLGL